MRIIAAERRPPLDTAACRAPSRTTTAAAPVDQWHVLIGDPTYANAASDCLVHNAHRIDLSDDSLRRTRPQLLAVLKPRAAW